MEAGVVDANGKVKVGFSRQSKTRRVPKEAILGTAMLEEIRRDMDKLKLPSWVSPAPRHPGESKWGKFTVDQWRTFCTINLPITLIRLWSSSEKGSRKQRMLDNFMHLVTAVKLATMRRMTPSRIALYQSHMHQYLTTLLELYPSTTITPYQHMSLHFGTILDRFGPTHAWRCFPFENYNYILQQIPSNNKFGALADIICEQPPYVCGPSR